MYLFYYTNQMHITNYMKILKTYLRHDSVQVSHLQGAQNVLFQKQLAMIGYHLQGSIVCSISGVATGCRTL
jgi:hypothetical protein